MEWAIIATVVAIPVVLFPAGFVAYLDIGGILRTAREARKVKVAVGKGA